MTFKHIFIYIITMAMLDKVWLMVMSLMWCFLVMTLWFFLINIFISKTYSFIGRGFMHLAVTFFRGCWVQWPFLDLLGNFLCGFLIHIDIIILYRPKLINILWYKYPALYVWIYNLYLFIITHRYIHKSTLTTLFSCVKRWKANIQLWSSQYYRVALKMQDIIYLCVISKHPLSHLAPWDNIVEIMIKIGKSYAIQNKLTFKLIQLKQIYSPHVCFFLFYLDCSHHLFIVLHWGIIQVSCNPPGDRVLQWQDHRNNFNIFNSKLISKIISPFIAVFGCKCICSTGGHFIKSKAMVTVRMYGGFQVQR